MATTKINLNRQSDLVLTSPAISTPTGIVKGDVGLSNVDNTSDANKPISTAAQAALDLKANLASPTFTGVPTAPTAAVATNTTQLATTAFVLANGGAGSGTFAELNAMKIAGTLVTGQYYLMTDFQTIYRQPDFDSDGNPKVGVDKTAAIEPLLLLAVSTTEFSEQVFSPSFPNDTIKYQINFNSNLTGGVGTGATKGFITERIDSRNNRTDYDNRTIMFKRYETVDASGVFNSYKDTGFASVEVLTFSSDANSIDNYIGNYNQYYTVWSEAFLLANNVFGSGCYVNKTGDYFINNTFGNDNFSNTFGNINSFNTFGDNYYSNTLGNNNSFNTFGDSNASNTFGNDNSSNTFGYKNSFNTFGDSNSYNTFGDDYSSNTFGNSNSSNTFGYKNSLNTFGDFNSSNTFGFLNINNTFGSLNINNILGNSNSSNTFGYKNSFNTFGNDNINNNLGNDNSYNTFGDSNSSNTFGENNSLNTFGDYNINNTFTNNITSLDFSLATHTKQPYHCEIVVVVGGAIRLFYYDAAFALQNAVATS